MLRPVDAVRGSFRYRRARLARAVAAGVWSSAAAVHALVGQRAGAADVVSTWSAAATNVWSSATNWGNAPPAAFFPNNGNGGMTYDAVIAGGSVTLDLDVAVQKLTLSLGTLQGGFAVTASELVTFAGGTLSGTGVLNAAGGVLMGANNRNFTQRRVNASNASSWTAGTVNSGFGAVFHNAGTFTTNFNGGWFSNLGGGAVTFENAGEFRKTAGAGVTTMNVVFNSTGQVFADAGTISFTAGGLAAGAFVMAGGATVDFTAGAYTLLGGAGFSGAGTARVNGGTLAVNAPVSAQNFAVVSGSLTGGDVLTVSRLDWTGGTITGTGAVSVPALGVVAISGGATKSFTSRIISNSGVATWSGGQVNAGFGATFNNSGTFTAAVDAGWFDNLGGGPPVFNNSGSLVKSAGTGVTTFGLPFNNSGTVTAGVGTISFTGGGSAGGAFVASAGAAVEFGAGTYTLAAGSSLSGGGTARLTGSGTLNVTGTVPAARLAHAAGTLTGLAGGNLVVSGAYDWTGGTITGEGALSLPVGSAMSISGLTKTYTVRTISNSGTATWSGGQINAGFAATFNNSGTFTAAVDAGFFDNLGGAPPVFNNSGSVVKSAGTGVTTFSTAFNNSGAVAASVGTLRLSGGGSSTGTFVAGPGATLDFGGGTQNVSGAGSSVSGGGTVRFGGGVTNFNAGSGVYNVSGTTAVSGGTVNFNAAAPATSAGVELSAGTLGSGGVFVGTAFNWTGGTVGGTGVVRVPAGGALAMGGGTKSILGGNVENLGVATWSAGQVNAGLGGTFHNAGTFAAAVDQGIFDNLGGGTPVFHNSGTFVKSAGTGVTTLGLPFNNVGTVSAGVGTIAVSAGGSASGRFHAEPGAVVNFTGGSYTLMAGARFTGGGAARVSGGTVALDAAAAVPADQFELTAGGTLSGAGMLTVNGAMTWTGGSLSATADGATLVLPAGTAHGFAGATKSLLRRAVNNGGTVNWTAGQINAGFGATFNNNGTFTAAVDQGIFDNLGGGTPVFNNSGSLVKSAGTGVTTFGLPFNNTGTVTAAVGTVRMTGGGSATGRFEAAAAGSAIEFTGGAYTLRDGAAFGGPGPARISGAATVAADGAVVNANTFEHAAGAILTGGGNLVAGTGYAWSGGSMSGTGSTTVAPGAAFTLSGAAKSVTQRTIHNQGSATWSAGTINGGFGANFVNAGTFTATFDGGYVDSLGGGPPVFNNTGTFVKAGGTGVTSVSAVFNNNGTVAVNVGTVQFLGGGSGAGSVALALGARVQFAGGAHTLAGPAGSITGGGSGVVHVLLGSVGVGGAVDVGTTTVAGALTMLPGAAVGQKVLRTKVLTITGKVDLTNNHAIVDYDGASPLTAVRAAILSAYVPAAANHWLGATGLTSSFAAANTAIGLAYAESSVVLGAGGGVFSGQAVDGTAVLVRYTLFGDATLDGAVDFNDLVRLAQNYNVVDGSRIWSSGDFTYDGNTDFNDLVKLAQNYNTALPAGGIEGAGAGFEADLARAFASVPEPGGVGVVWVAGWAFARRRRGH